MITNRLDDRLRATPKSCIQYANLFNLIDASGHTGDRGLSLACFVVQYLPISARLPELRRRPEPTSDFRRRSQANQGLEWDSV